MGVPNQNQNPSTSTSSSSHLIYPQELQLKLYQALIFSVPILFSIILLLLFYLFYLKRTRESSNSLLPSTTLNNQPTSRITTTSILPSMSLDVGLIKEEVKEKLQIVTFDENSRDKDSLCCVCLGDFEPREQLQQIPSCRHVFHVECIRHWLRANSTCPLCRCFVLPVKKAVPVEPPLPPV